MLDENANLGGQPAAGRPYGKDWHCALRGSQKTDNSTFSQFCGEEPCWRLSNAQMFKDTHSHLFNIAGSKDSCRDNPLCVSCRAKAPGMYGTTLDKNNRSRAIELFRRFRCTVAREVLRSGDENELLEALSGRRRRASALASVRLSNCK